MKAHGATLAAPRDARLELGFARALNAGDLVLRRIEEHWKLAIAAPWGWADRRR